MQRPSGWRVWLRCERTKVGITPQVVVHVYRDSLCDIQPWARAAHIYCSAYVDSAFHPLLDGKMSISLWADCWVVITMAMVDVDDSCQISADSQPKTIGLIWKLAATRRSVYIHQMNRLNALNDLGLDEHHKHFRGYYYYFFALGSIWSRG